MLKLSAWLNWTILGLIALAALIALPNVLPASTREKLPDFMNRTINLGLDLQGGSYLLLGVDTDGVVSNRLTALKQDIQGQLRAAGSRKLIAQSQRPTVNAREGTVTLVVRDATEVEEAADRIRNLTRANLLAGGARPYDVKVEGARITVRIMPEAARQFAREAVADSLEVIRRRIDPAGNKEVSIQPQGTDRIVVQVPGDNDPEHLKELINRTGQLTFHAVDPTVSLEDAAAGAPERIVVPMSEGGAPLVLNEEPVITGDMVQTASAGINQDGGGFQINFSFDNRGALRFAEYTRDHIGDAFAIVLDNEIISAPTIQTAIPGGSGRITGNFTPEEASRIALLIRSGALPAKLTTLEQRTVGPDLGADSIRAGGVASLVALALVVTFMLVTYGRFGVYANIALIANVTLILGALTLFGSTLTLPGIAGIVLTMGMAVDANVLIYERIREEIAAGKPVIKAAELGFEKAFSAIADSNITTLLAALIMLMLGAGPVRGFAVTLSIGVLTSVFTAILLTRMLVGQYLLSKRPAKIVL
ncbi:MAG: protein translocase subunit SecD [Parvularculaceae bacterium]|jgi:protein-export membrane protein SecD|nr:protein translocase subunit SecD [Parvularculaceae bacterium]